MDDYSNEWTHNISIYDSSSKDYLQKQKKGKNII